MKLYHYRSDMDCFIPLMEHFKQTYGFYLKYPVADAGYGSYNNYIFCEQNGMEKYMKFPMFKKETKDRKYHEDPFRAVNFRIDEQGVMRCPNDKAFHLLYRRSVRGNQYGRKEELYECEDCSGCPYAEKCKKTDKNRTVRINQELICNASGSNGKLRKYSWGTVTNEPLSTSRRHFRNHEKRPLVQENCPKRY